MLSSEKNSQREELTYRAKRMRLINNGQTVELSYHDPYTDTDRTRTFWVPSQGGYVRQTTWKRPGTLGLQVCERLDTGGATLTATPDNLAAGNPARISADAGASWQGEILMCEYRAITVQELIDEPIAD